jgi:hypothetical protein
MTAHQILSRGLFCLALLSGLSACKQDTANDAASVQEIDSDDTDLSSGLVPANPFDTIDVPEGFVIVTGGAQNPDAPPMPKFKDSTRREGISIPIPPESRSRKGSAIKREQPEESMPPSTQSVQKVDVQVLSDRLIRQIESKGVKLDASQKTQIKQLAGGVDLASMTDPNDRKETRAQLLEIIKRDVLRPEQRALLD